MVILGGNLGYRILRGIAPAEPARLNGSAYSGRSKLEALLGNQVWEHIRNKLVIDFGCGTGTEAIELAQHGARQVYGIDIQDRWLQIAREEAEKLRCENVSFGKTAPEPVDVIVSLDALEHIGDPAAALGSMANLLKPGGCVLISFGPPWYHPLGGHLFSVFPWAHLVFTEEALCRWRSHLRNDGAKRFCEVEGGLNQMTIGRFERIVASSPFRIEWLEAVPIRGVRFLHNRLTREFLTSVVRCKLVPRGGGQP